MIPAKDILHGHDARWLMNCAGDAMLVVGADGGILLANPAAVRLFGYSLAEFSGLLVEDLIPPRFRDSHGEKRADFAHHPEFRRMGSGLELYCLRKDGGEFATDVSISPFEDGHVLVTVYDISDRKQLEEEQKRMIHELEAVNEELRNFAYVVSHDLKAPLRAIGSLADWIAADQQERLDADGQEHLRLLIQRVRRMDALIDGVLRYSRIGRVHEAVSAIDLNELARDVIDSLAPPPDIVVSVAPDLPTVRAEKTCIYQVLQNLLSNAIRYLDKPAGRIDIACVELADCWQLSVADNGPGIAPRHFERIFQLFQTLHPRDRVESTGVGLSIVKKIVEQSGGRVWLESELGQGSTFYFSVPKISLNL
ncbi:ATP-binding protein [Methylomonas sp. SURF-2]|uniref:histidine kinase n=1 Tax=Methylomonas subterranea TaxID=2952225 RepID=A0ABT1TH16_9GAMM|nr:ATP-binding protein [Methylomonas sp. SURF-2]MCQ8104756.1 ATP-binding protein [Methylomonas sp. SURF-2]